VLRGLELRAQYGVNQWLEQKQLITSLDLAKRDDILLSLRQAHWDLVIVDEAHRFDCLIFNFVATNTVEGHVLQRLLEKLQEIRDALNEDAVFNVVGEVLPAAHIDRWPYRWMRPMRCSRRFGFQGMS